MVIFYSMWLCLTKSIKQFNWICCIDFNFFKLNCFINFPVECSSYFLYLSSDHYFACLHIDFSLIYMLIIIRSVIKHSLGKYLDGTKKNTWNCESFKVMAVMPRLCKHYYFNNLLCSITKIRYRKNKSSNPFLLRKIFFASFYQRDTIG